MSVTRSEKPNQQRIRELLAAKYGPGKSVQAIESQMRVASRDHGTPIIGYRTLFRMRDEQGYSRSGEGRLNWKQYTALATCLRSLPEPVLCITEDELFIPTILPYPTRLDDLFRLFDIANYWYGNDEVILRVREQFQAAQIAVQQGLEHMSELDEKGLFRLGMLAVSLNDAAYVFFSDASTERENVIILMQAVGNAAACRMRFHDMPGWKLVDASLDAIAPVKCYEGFSDAKFQYNVKHDDWTEYQRLDELCMKQIYASSESGLLSRDQVAYLNCARSSEVLRGAIQTGHEQQARRVLQQFGEYVNQPTIPNCCRIDFLIASGLFHLHSRSPAKNSIAGLDALESAIQLSCTAHGTDTRSHFRAGAIATKAQFFEITSDERDYVMSMIAESNRTPVVRGQHIHFLHPPAEITRRKRGKKYSVGGSG